MFKCPKCETLADEVKFLRDANTRLIDRLTAIADARAFEAVNFRPSNHNDFYGNGDDLYESYDKFGERIVLKKSQEVKS